MLLQLPVEIIKTDVEGDIDPYAFRKLAANFYKQRFAVRYGDDFENNLLLQTTRGAERKLLDKYTKIKLGKSKLNAAVEEYNKPFLEALAQDGLELLLYLCRFCSYLGGPGVPDILLVDGKTLKMRQLNVELQANQIIFIALARLLGYDVKLYDVETRSRKADSGEKAFDVFSTIKEILSSKDVSRKLEEEIQRNKLISDDIHAKDEAIFLANERIKMPLHMLEKWLAERRINLEDLRCNMKDIACIHEAFVAEMLEYENALRSDSAYLSFSRAKTDENLRTKVEYFKKKFSIGQSKAIELLNWME